MRQGEFARLWKVSEDTLLVYARLLVKDEKLAYELLQDTYNELSAVIGDLENSTAFALQSRRNMVMLVQREFRAINEETEKKAAGTKCGPDVKGVRDFVRDTVNDLPQDQRVCFDLYYYENMEIGYIAEFMDASEEEIRKNLRCSRHSVNLELERYERDAGIDMKEWIPFPLMFISMEDMAVRNLKK